jgi:hypothetical protein
MLAAISLPLGFLASVAMINALLPTTPGRAVAVALWNLLITVVSGAVVALFADVIARTFAF